MTLRDNNGDIVAQAYPVLDQGRAGIMAVLEHNGCPVTLLLHADGQLHAPFGAYYVGTGCSGTPHTFPGSHFSQDVFGGCNFAVNGNNQLYQFTSTATSLVNGIASRITYNDGGCVAITPQDSNVVPAATPAIGNLGNLYTPPLVVVP